jgi:hypothetical protein
MSCEIRPSGLGVPVVGRGARDGGEAEEGEMGWLSGKAST